MTVTMDYRYFSCDDCRQYVESGYRWAYWHLEHPGVVHVGSVVNAAQILAVSDYWSPPPEDQPDWLVHKTLPAVRDFLLTHAQHSMRYLDDRHLEELGYEEIMSERDAALHAYYSIDAAFCTNDILSEDVSPNGAFKAVRFRRGVSASYSTQVSVLPSARSLENKEGNVVIVLGAPCLLVQWLDDTHLNILGSGSSISMKHVSTFNGIKISYD